MYIVCSVLVNLGYFWGLSKCVLVPVTRIRYLGMIVDSIAQAFCIPEDKKIKFAQLREQILLRESAITLKSLSSPRNSRMIMNTNTDKISIV